MYWFSEKREKETTLIRLKRMNLFSVVGVNANHSIQWISPFSTLIIHLRMRNIVNISNKLFIPFWTRCLFHILPDSIRITNDTVAEEDVDEKLFLSSKKIYWKFYQNRCSLNAPFNKKKCVENEDNSKWSEITQVALVFKQNPWSIIK